MRLRVLFAWLSGSFMVVVIVVQLAAIVNRTLLADYRRAVAQHQTLVSLSNELQRSSDSLTEAVQNFVGSGEARWIELYNDVLAVRNGEKPRPDGRVVALRELFREAGCTEAELAMLAKAEEESNKLAGIEANLCERKECVRMAILCASTPLGERRRCSCFLVGTTTWLRLPSQRLL